MEDFDRDGHLDVMVSSWGRRDPLRYFRNSGDGAFAERTEAAGLAGIVGGLNCKQPTTTTTAGPTRSSCGEPGSTARRHDGGRRPNSLLRNLGGSRFDDVTEAAGHPHPAPDADRRLGDYDNDGWLDLYIGNESFGAGRHPCELFHNEADGTFRDRAAAAGLAVEGYVKAVVWGDYDNDGMLDLYLSRLHPKESNLLFRNGGGGSPRFADVTEAAGVPGPRRSFPAWFWDYDNDGWLDIFVSGYKARPTDVAAEYLGLESAAEHPRLYRNAGDGTFADVTAAARLDKALLTMGSNYGDLDNDGYLDCYLGTGDPCLITLMPNRMFRNAAGRFFQDVTTSGGSGICRRATASPSAISITTATRRSSR